MSDRSPYHEALHRAADHQHRKADMRRCEECGGWMAGYTRGGHRRKARYCSPRCAGRANARKRRDET